MAKIDKIYKNSGIFPWEQEKDIDFLNRVFNATEYKVIQIVSGSYWSPAGETNWIYAIIEYYE